MSRAACWGPWEPGLDPAERKARLRALRALVRAYAGPKGADLAQALRAAETDLSALGRASDLLAHLPTVPARHVLAAYARL